MYLTEYDEEEQMNLFYEDGVEDGAAQVWAIMIVKRIRSLLDFTSEESLIAQKTELPVSLVHSVLQQISEHPDWSDAEVAEVLHLQEKFPGLEYPVQRKK